MKQTNVDVAMVKVYADTIRKGLKTLEQVPEEIRAEVRELMGLQEG